MVHVSFYSYYININFRPRRVRFDTFNNGTESVIDPLHLGGIDAWDCGLLYQLIAEAPRFLRCPWMLQGNVSVVINVATFWGFTTSNYEMLSRLQKTYADQPVLLPHALFFQKPTTTWSGAKRWRTCGDRLFLQNTMPKNVGLLPINSGSVAKDQWPTILRLKKQLMFKTACIWIMLVHVASFSAGYGYFSFLFNPRNPLLLFVPLQAWLQTTSS